MTGYIIRNIDTDVRHIYEILNTISSVKKHNWLMTNTECYPDDKELFNVFSKEYCWKSGTDLLNMFVKEQFQWVWGVFSAFPKEIDIQNILQYDLPYADGYKGFWENPLTLQHPLAIIEVVVWDGKLVLVLAKDKKLINDISNLEYEVIDLEIYNTKG